MKKHFLVLVLPFLFFACSDDDIVSVPPQLDYNDKFGESKQGWTAGFADYPVAMDSDWALKEGIAKLPAPLDTLKKGFMISGNNHSDDLFMYFKKKVSGLKANQKYTASFTVEFASNAPSSGWSGVGGAPNSISVGVGATTFEPKDTIDALNYHRLNIGKMNQFEDGKDMKIIGDVGNGTEVFRYTLLTKTGDFTGTTDAKGNLWLIVGTDSGFEATTTLYYTGIAVKLKEVTGN